MTTSVKVKFRPSTVTDKEGVLYYQIIHNRTVRQITTAYKLYATEWDTTSQTVLSNSSTPARKSHLTFIQKHFQWDIERLRQIIATFSQSDQRFSADDIITEYHRLTTQGTFSKFMDTLITQYEAHGQIRTAETYTAARNSFIRFSHGEEIPLDGIDTLLMQQYESWLLHTAGVTYNTSSFYMRKLRAAYNVAVERGLTQQRHPFRNVYTGKDKTAKRAVPLEIIKRIKNLDLSQAPFLQLSRDLFLFSLYTRGMSFIDMAWLKKDNLQSGHLIYRRHKTGQQLSIKWESCMKELVKKYEGLAKHYLLPIIVNDGDERGQYKRMQYRVNHALKRVSEMAGIAPALTMYVARHSWASIAKSKHIPTAIISEGMGHDSEQTTRIYLASLDTSVVDKANKKILDLL